MPCLKLHCSARNITYLCVKCLNINALLYCTFEMHKNFNISLQLFNLIGFWLGLSDNMRVPMGWRCSIHAIFVSVANLISFEQCFDTLEIKLISWFKELIPSISQFSVHGNQASECITQFFKSHSCLVQRIAKKLYLVITFRCVNTTICKDPRLLF